MRHFLPAALLAAAAALAACASAQVAINPRADFSQIKRVAVVTFAGSSGDTAADVMTQYLVAYGANVIERQQLNAVLQEQHLASSGILDNSTVQQVGKILGVDALIVGQVTNFTPSQTYIAQGGPNSFVSGVTPINGASVYSEGSVPGLPNSQVLASAATVGLVARMVDVQTGTILWSAMMNYEGFDTQTAMQEIASSFVDSLVPVWPALIRPKG